MVTALIASKIRTASALLYLRESAINNSTAICLSKEQAAALRGMTTVLDEIIASLVPNTASKED